ncbi:hypothetical protein EV207_12519 [Scopulibacillus darangshiensis]|uniref:Uncharacterized protein n=1 Tax=Scopulibacillus darangshiensis TaxID=442528 RepID=A0A4R2NRA7_9BACL|nr:hypothetical protein [Scopulibacillus darangshiensis]TCP24459.1 hypothetical protein EV207_12519 [Scopulibacillus darangshiensis]
MANKVSKAMERKAKMQERIEKMEKEMKELEVKAQQDIGAFVLKTWDIQDDSEKVFEVITSLKDQANKLLNNEGDSMGKSEQENIQTTPSH